MSVIIRKNEFTVTVDADYLLTIQSLANAICFFDEEHFAKENKFYLCNLLSSMLPSEDQILCEEDAELLKQAKQAKYAASKK